VLIVELSPEFRKHFVVTIEGQDFVKYGGLITLAKESKLLKGIRSQLIQAPTPENGNLAIVAACAVDAEGNEWWALGDADDKNCNRKVAAAKVRIADTRAKGRALRDLLGIDMVMYEELTPDVSAAAQAAGQAKITAAQANRITELMRLKNLTREQGLAIYQRLTGKGTLLEATVAEADALIAELEQLPYPAPATPPAEASSAESAA
jgi:hypothetical protein